MKEKRILLTEPMFIGLCKKGYYSTPDSGDLYFTKEDIKTLATGKIASKEESGIQWLFMLQDIGFDMIDEILKRSPIYMDLAGNFLN